MNLQTITNMANAVRRVSNFLQDGYTIRVQSISATLCFWKLIHSNGSVITLTVHPTLDLMLQKTNNKIVYYGSIQS